MLVEFMMITDDIQHQFKAMGKMKGNTLSFPDKMIPNTLIDIIFDDDMLIINRHGKTEMYQEFKLNHKLKGIYKNDMGLELEIYSDTLELSISEHEVAILYDFYIENDKQSRNKLIIKY